MSDQGPVEIPESGDKAPNPLRLDHLFRPDLAAAPFWTDAELRDIFRHQLDASLAFDLSRGNPAEFNVIWLEASHVTPPPRTFGELFCHPQPPMALLYRVKEFAKVAYSNSDVIVPAEIASFLYHGAVSAALTRHGRRITSRSDAALLAGLRSLLHRDWLDTPSRLVLAAAVKLILPDL